MWKFTGLTAGAGHTTFMLSLICSSLAPIQMIWNAQCHVKGSRSDLCLVIPNSFLGRDFISGNQFLNDISNIIKLKIPVKL